MSTAEKYGTEKFLSQKKRLHSVTLERVEHTLFKVAVKK